MTPTRIPMYPARPMNGGPFPKARKPVGQRIYSPKYNEWRMAAHAPSLQLWNRHGEPLSIASEFAEAMDALAQVSAATGIEWFDCGGLERRHDIGRGSLVIIDILPVTPELNVTWLRRSAMLDGHIGRLPFDARPHNGRLYRPDLIPGNIENWERLKEVNRQWGCEFYEGFVSYRIDSLYPNQSRNPNLETADWTKHRWGF